MNWSAPTDALWVSGSLRCQSPGEVLLLLKSSDVVLSDLSSAFRHCVDAEAAPPVTHIVALRKWALVEPAREFRCFVAGGRIVGLTQRNVNTFFPHLVDDRHWLAPLLQECVLSEIDPVFPRRTYCVDLYVTAKRAVFVIDFNVFAAVTDPGLCDWDELQRLADTGGCDDRLRVVEVPTRVVPSSRLFHGVPKDLLDSKLLSQVAESQGEA